MLVKPKLIYLLVENLYQNLSLVVLPLTNLKLACNYLSFDTILTNLSLLLYTSDLI